MMKYLIFRQPSQTNLLLLWPSTLMVIATSYYREERFSIEASQIGCVSMQLFRCRAFFVSSFSLTAKHLSVVHSPA